MNKNNFNQDILMIKTDKLLQTREIYRTLREYSELLREYALEEYKNIKTITIAELAQKEEEYISKVSSMISELNYLQCIEILEYILVYVNKPGFEKITQIVLDELLLRFNEIRVTNRRLDEQTEEIEYDIEIDTEYISETIKSLEEQIEENISKIEKKEVSIREKNKFRRIIELYEHIRYVIDKKIQNKIDKVINKEIEEIMNKSKSILDLKEREKAVSEMNYKKGIDLKGNEVFLKFTNYYVSNKLIEILNKKMDLNINKLAENRVIVSGIDLSDLKQLYTTIYIILKYMYTYDEEQVKRYAKKSMLENGLISLEKEEDKYISKIEVRNIIKKY